VRQVPSEYGATELIFTEWIQEDMDMGPFLGKVSNSGWDMMKYCGSNCSIFLLPSVQSFCHFWLLTYLWSC
jgi:uncharacterized membrane protein YukC